MAASRDPRLPYSSRRDESSTQAADEARHKSTAGRSSDHSDRYDSRYHYPPSSSTTDRARQQQRSPLRKRRSWPPRPFAEEEIASLRREYNSRQWLRDAAKHEVPSRGTVDQEPLIIEVPEFVNQHDRRFVLADHPSNNTGIPTPPTSEDERLRKPRRKPSTLNIRGPDVVPEAASRTASPYAYVRPTNSPRAASSSSRHALTDNPTTQRGGSSNMEGARSGAAHKPTSSRRDSGRLSGGVRFTAENDGNENAIDDTGYESSHAYTKSSKRTEKPLAQSPRVSAVDSAQSAGTLPIRKMNLDARRNTDSQNTLPTFGRLGIDKSRRPTPLVVSSSLSEAQDIAPIASASLDPRSADTYRYREPSFPSSSRGPSPAGSATLGTPSPSHSPRTSVEFSKEGSAIGSRPSSATSSRPASPSPRTPTEPPRLARPDQDWNALLAANAARRPKPPSRLTRVQLDTDPGMSRRGQEESRQSSLPYPVDSSSMGLNIVMPEEQNHAYQPGKKPSLVPSKASESNTFVRSASPGASAAATSPRPVLARGYSTGYATTIEPRSAVPRPRPAEPKRTESFATTSETRKEIASLMKKGLPPCPRPDAVAGHDDWHTVAGAPTNIDFCPDCIGTLFERTLFRQHFRRSLPRNLNDKVQCAFGSPWTRLAWLLTLQQHRTDLSLLKDLAEIDETTGTCPGTVHSVRSWYGLRDPDGLFVRDFHVCFADVRKIERLLPTLGGMLVKLPQRASSGERICALRTDGNRFSAYLDALVSTHERAISTRQGADSLSLIELVERKTRLRDCSRDNMLAGGLWHQLPDAPTLTVCEDCFDAVVEPCIRSGAAVAKKFVRTVQPVYGEGLGSSCQLYSRRMRRIWQRALEENDTRYLARKSRERREAELWLQERYREVMRRAKRAAAQEGGVGEEEERRLTRELEKISTEWKDKWE